MTSEEPYFYHCVINAFRNATLEVCAPRKIIFGYCTEYNVAGGVIQRHASVKCNSTFPKCDKSYNSTEAYKYLDCYELVNKKQVLKTTTVPPVERTTKSKPDHGNKPIIYVMIAAVVATCVGVVFFLRFKRHRKSTAMDEECNDLIENERDSPIKFLYINTKHFQHFSYVNNLAKDCELRLEKVINDKNRRKCMSDKEIMIGIVGNHTVDNLNLLSKGKEDKKMRGEMLEINYGAIPLLCFQKSALEILRRENACYKILIQSEESCSKTNKKDDSIIIVGQNKQQIKEVITTCLEKHLDEMLQDWLEKLKHEGLKKQTFEIFAEIEAIRKQLILDTSINTAVPIAPCIDNKSIVPNDVKDYLLGRFEVNGFGIWGCSTFQIFVKKATDNKILKKELIKLNQNFFQKYQLEIESRNMVEKQTMRNYYSISLMYNLGGTLNKLFTKSNDKTKKHENNLAFMDAPRESSFIGPCSKMV